MAMPGEQPATRCDAPRRNKRRADIATKVMRRFPRGSDAGHSVVPASAARFSAGDHCDDVAPAYALRPSSMLAAAEYAAERGDSYGANRAVSAYLEARALGAMQPDVGADDRAWTIVRFLAGR